MSETGSVLTAVETIVGDVPPQEFVPWGAWLFYDEVSGEFIGRTFSGPHTSLTQHTPQGCAAVESGLVVDPASQKIDITTGHVIDWIPPPPQPADHYQWNPLTKRWEIRPEIALRLAAIAAARAEITRLETERQPRVVRELLLGIGVGSIDRLIDIEREIRRHRRVIREASGLAPSAQTDDQDFDVLPSAADAGT